MARGKGHRPPKVAQMPDGVWCVRASLGYDEVTHRQVRPFRRFPDATSREEAQELALRWFEELTDAFAGARSLRLRDLLPLFVESMPPGTKANTRRQYGHCAARLAPLLGGVAFDRLTPSAVDRAMRELRSTHARATVKQTRAFLGAAYSEWVSRGLLDRNPVRESHGLGGGEPGGERSLDERTAAALNAALMREMADEANGPASASKAAATWLALHTGMRRGELCALRLRDWRPRGGELHVCGTVVRTPAGLVRQRGAKTVTSNRTVRLSPAAARTFGEWVARRAAMPGAAPGPDAALFCDAKGGIIDPDALTRWFRESRPRLGLPEGVRFHDLRHTHATGWLLLGGDMGTLKKRLGHADVRTTLTNYAEVMPGMDADGAARFDEWIGSRDD